MWYVGKGDWQRSHDIVEVMHDQPSAHIHAFLHRKEGDLSNAKYWYTQASVRMPAYPLDQEWEELATGFLTGQ